MTNPQTPRYPTTLALAIDYHTQQLAASPVGFGHGTTNARDEAAWLVLWSLGLPLDTDITDAFAQQYTLSTAQQQALQSLFLARITTRQPAAYLTQEAWLQGIGFYCDPRAIVPRSLIAELLAEATFDPWLSDQTHRVLDVCTGNGSLAILAAMAYPDTVVVASDISAPALEVATINLHRHALTDRVQLVQCDGLNGVSGLFDLVLCNPPYVNAASMAQLPEEYRQEPVLALAGGEDGMDFIRQLLIDLPRCLHPNGVLVLEIGNERAHFDQAFPTLPVNWLETSAGADQVVVIEAGDLIEWASTYLTPS